MKTGRGPQAEARLGLPDTGRGAGVSAHLLSVACRAGGRSREDVEAVGTMGDATPLGDTGAGGKGGEGRPGLTRHLQDSAHLCSHRDPKDLRQRLRKPCDGLGYRK